MYKTTYRNLQVPETNIRISRVTREHHSFCRHWKKALYLSVNVLIGDTISYVSCWRQDRHFTWSSEQHEGLAACGAKGIPSFLSYFKALSIGPAPGIEPVTAPAPRSSALPSELILPRWNIIEPSKNELNGFAETYSTQRFESFKFLEHRSWLRKQGTRLMGMCSWMGSHLHDWIYYYGVAFI